jgi:prophage antirepressor-like protein
MNEIKVFDNAEFGKVRTTTVNGEVMFVGKDVADILGYQNGSRDINRHVDEEDRTKIMIYDGVQDKETIIINESGLYSLILSSKMPNAKKFKRWVTSEVLPSIRKHGIYATDNVIDNILNNPDFGIELLTRLKSERVARIAAEEEKERLQEELDYSKDWYSIKRVAAMNGVEWKKFKWRRLKEKSIELGYGVKKIFDANYGEVNTYHRDVWEAVYPEYEI